MSDRQSTEQPSILVIGADPDLVDFSHPDYAAYPGMNAAKVKAGLAASKALLESHGYDVDVCVTDLGDTAEQLVADVLGRRQYDCVLIGAGVRNIAGNFLLFETLVNVVHASAPRSKLCFNRTPSDIVEAVRRWI